MLKYFIIIQNTSLNKYEYVEYDVGMGILSVCLSVCLAHCVRTDKVPPSPDVICCS